MTRRYRFKGLLTATGWIEDVTVDIDPHGIITDIIENAPHAKGVVNVEGYAMSGFINAHSHAFQYLMAGDTEHLPIAATGDDFWSWRETMYRLALSISPESLEIIAAQLYAEMLRHGFTAVAEFHYLHHRIDGRPYANVAEMGQRLLNAADIAGIRLTLVPVYYNAGGFSAPPTQRQRRFVSKTIDAYLLLLDACKSAVKQHALASCGCGIHSLRAATADDTITLAGLFDSAMPKHIHLAEQRAEVVGCIADRGAAPVRWCLDKLECDHSWNFVHATHVTDDELASMATRGVRVVLCPSTEGNLGDGIFPLVKFSKYGGQWSIGTDSHIGLNPHEEIRLLDYGQRLTARRRNVLCRNGGDNSAEIAYSQTQANGNRALGRGPHTGLAVGQPLDAVVYDATTPLLSAKDRDKRLSTIIYASDPTWILGTIVGGEFVVRRGRHANSTIAQNFRKLVS